MKNWLSKTDNKVLVLTLISGMIMLAVIFVAHIFDMRESIPIGTGSEEQQEESEKKSTSDTKYDIHDFVGDYNNNNGDRANVKIFGDGDIKVFIVFNDTSEWNVKGHFNTETGVLEYTDGVKNKRSYKEDLNGEKQVDTSEIVYQNGTGRLVFKRENEVSSFTFEPDGEYRYDMKNPFERVGDGEQKWISRDGQILTFDGFQYKWENGEDYIQGEYELYYGEDAKTMLDAIVEKIEENENVTENMLESIYSKQETWEEGYGENGEESFDKPGNVLFILKLDEGKIDGEDAVLMETVYRGAYYRHYNDSSKIGLNLYPLVGTAKVQFDEEKNAKLENLQKDRKSYSVFTDFTYILPNGYEITDFQDWTGGDGAGIMGMTATSENGKDIINASVSYKIGVYKRSEWVEMDRQMRTWLPITEIDGVYYCKRQIGPVIESAYFFERGNRCYSFSSTNENALDDFFSSVEFRESLPVRSSGFAVGDEYYVTSFEGLNVRSEPSARSDSSILKKDNLPSKYRSCIKDNNEKAVLKYGSKVTCKGLNDNGNWMLIADGCWVCANDGEPLIEQYMRYSPEEVESILSNQRN